MWRCSVYLGFISFNDYLVISRQLIIQIIGVTSCVPRHTVLTALVAMHSLFRIQPECGLGSPEPKMNHTCVQAIIFLSLGFLEHGFGYRSLVDQHTNLTMVTLLGLTHTGVFYFSANHMKVSAERRVTSHWLQIISCWKNASVHEESQRRPTHRR